jgi:hypothetical protein
LETRRLLSASDLPLGITAVQLESITPPNGQGAAPAQELVISFEQSDVNAVLSELSGFFGGTYDFSYLINTLDSNKDFELDGPLGTVFGFADPPAVETVSSNRVETNVSIPIANTLAPGTYQLSLNWGTGLDFLYGALDSSLANAIWSSLNNSTAPVTIAQLTVQPPPPKGPTLSNATSLGTIGSTVQNVWGTLDPGNVPSAVAFYQITLAPGHLWEVGLQVSASSVGSKLLPDLTLFDAKGNVLATRTAGTGIPTDPNDPYLFEGLQPGTYYVGVSGDGNLPNVAGGYNQFTGAYGGAGRAQPGGPFRYELSVVAEAHDGTTNLLSFSLSHEDPNDPSPSSITLSFSAPIDLSNLFIPDVQETALDVVDSSGHDWPITAEDYQVTTNQLTLIFDQWLPPGTYSLVEPPTGGLTDLAGVSVVAPGQPAGVLATWTVSASGTGSANDLGTLWPSTGGVVWPTGNGSFSGTTSLTAGEDATFRWVVIVPGTYKLQTQVQGGEIEVINSGSGSTMVLDTGSTNYLNNYLMTLPSGVYELKMVNVGPDPALVHWLLKIESLDWEKILDNGVSASSALSLMTFSPTLAAPATGPITGFMSVAPSAGGDPSAASMGPVASSLFVTLNSGLMGQPGWDGQSLAPAAASLPPAGSFAGQSLLDGNASLLVSEDDSSADTVAKIEAPATETAPIGRVTSIQANVIAPGVGPDSASDSADARALAQAEWITQIASMVKGWFATSPGETRITPLAGEPPAPLLAGEELASARRHDDASSRTGQRSAPIVRSDVAAVAGLVTVGAVAIRLRKPIKKWWRQSARLAVPEQRMSPLKLSGPHATVKAGRIKNRVRVR